MIDYLSKQNASCVCKIQPLAMAPCGRKKLFLTHHNCIVSLMVKTLLLKSQATTLAQQQKKTIRLLQSL
jgi:hypothetical protein